jgi:uncharacterized delta-60 repeat protein
MRRVIALTICFLGLSRVQASLLDSSFDIGSGADGLVEQALQLPDGKVLICGNFTTFNGINRGYIARLNSNGGVDESFAAHPGYWVRHMALQADGKIVVGGYFTTVEGEPRSLIARLNSDGSLDPSFNPGTGADIIIAGGVDGNVTPFVFWQDVQPDGKIVITGNFREYNGESATGIVRLNPDGSRDTSFQIGQAFDSWGRFIKILPNSQILVSGWFTSYNGQNANRLVRINQDGSRDTSFNPFYGDRTAIYAVALTPDGKYITSGDSLNADGLFKRNIEKLNVDGTVDESWVGTSSDKTESLLALTDGSVIVAGYFTLLDDQSRQSIGRLNPDGTLDPNLVVNVDNFIWTIAPAASDKILIAGGFTTVDGQSRRGVARLNVSGAVQVDPNPPPAPVLMDPRMTRGQFAVTVATVAGHSYSLQGRGPNDSTWTNVQTITATGTSEVFFDAPNGPRLYRAEVK